MPIDSEKNENEGHLNLELTDCSKLSIELENSHKEYLIHRHGTIELDPLPSQDPEDPLNWPNKKKYLLLGLVAFHAMSNTFMGAGIVPAFESMSEQYGVTMEAIAYLTSVQIVVSGIFPLLWLPLMNKYGRRPFLLASVLGAMAFNIGGGFCSTYGQQMALRALTAFFISPSAAVGSVIVTELCFSRERGQKTGWWAMMMTIGTPAGPFIMGFVQQHAGTKWIYWTFAIMNICQFLGYLFFGPETLYSRDGFIVKRVNWWRLTRLDSQPLSWKAFLAPLKLAAVQQVIIPICAYAIVFCYANIALIVELPQVFGRKFHLDSQQTGLQFIALIIGSAIGEQLAGPLSDWWMKLRIRNRGRKIIEDRLWLSYPGFLMVIVGLIVWGVRTQQAAEGHWNITPLIGSGIAAAGNQIITTTLITFAIDVNSKVSSEVGLLVNVVRQVFGFLGPFYFPVMFNNLGFGGAGGLMAGLVGVFACIPIILLHFSGLRRQGVRA
ncbi:MFS general substrate transporter [Nadsonia fulvescens var. elongata DSM 6958]|uniref:MFS general substrate transporter n=1 Tax=Nadsonia fulvescens var. elongata DSM 6958 TaxID=857566 RepID=A0A1E3PPP0_9ASCO|nr:MFS general substrate transporter [Nadsonia fulvescens var. elongata DSM 6958]